MANEAACWATPLEDEVVEGLHVGANGKVPKRHGGAPGRSRRVEMWLLVGPRTLDGGHRMTCVSMVYLLLDLWVVAGDAAVVKEAARHADGVVDSSVIGGRRVTDGEQHFGQREM